MPEWEAQRMQPTSQTPLVSVVIPTRSRPQLVCHAVSMALQQTYANLEVIVVVDGPDEATVKRLKSLNEPRLFIVALKEGVGGSEARNLGVHAAGGAWIALLDDDDEWMPEKIERQMVFATLLEDNNAFVACRFFNEDLGSGAVSPYRLPRTKENISEYLFWPNGVRGGEGFLQTSTLLISRELMLRVPFVKDLKRGQELSWMLSACAYGQAAFYVLPEILSTFKAGEKRAGPRISSQPKWMSYYRWMRANPNCFTPRAYTYCVAAGVIPDAIRSGESFATLIRLAWEGSRDGRLTLKSLVKFGYTLFFSAKLRRKVTMLFQPSTS